MSSMDEVLTTIKDGVKANSSEIKEIKDNHLAHLKTDMTEVKTNVDWLIKSHWKVTMAIMVSIVVSAIGAFFAYLQ